ncbi:MAG: plasmid pRiA4b ORF-3 family protein [Acidobacteriota bacterium]|nr:plasmid pRiA4b ORF-3 family protein [Acidobacteriota bacterium]
MPPDPAFKHPVCLAGANACPPEDCGGMDGKYIVCWFTGKHLLWVPLIGVPCFLSAAQTSATQLFELSL